MPIRYKCDECGVALTIKDELAGTDGKCPNCKTRFKVPEVGNSPAKAAEDISEEDAIFGKDFFSAKQPAQRPRYVPSSDDDDDDSDETPVVSVRRPAVTPASPPPSGDNAANVAGALLSKTGKKNRPADYTEPEPGKVEYDFSELKYRLTHQILPLLGIAIVVIPALYLVMDSMFSDGSLLPVLAPVSGVVRVDSQPVAARLDFIPKVEQNALTGSAIAQSGPDGVYRANFNQETEGAVVGPNQVRIMASGHTFYVDIEVTTALNPGGEYPKYNFDLVTPGGGGPKPARNE